MLSELMANICELLSGTLQETDLEIKMQCITKMTFSAGLQQCIPLHPVFALLTLISSHILLHLYNT